MEVDNNSLTSSSIDNISENENDSSLRNINPDTNDLEGFNLYDEIETEYIPNVQTKNLGISEHKIICVEMKNNNKIYIEYEDYWTIKDLINMVIKSKDFHKLYSPNQQFILASDYIEGMFDLNLSVFRNIKSDLDTKIGYYIQLGYLRNQGLLSNYRYPLLIFNDCRANYPIPQEKELNKLIINDYEKTKEVNLFWFYQKVLPRANSFNLLTKSPNFRDIFLNNKNGINKISRILFDELISEENSKEWYNYDYESICFIINYEQMDWTHTESNTIIQNKTEIFFQDKLSYIDLALLSNHKQFLISVIVNKDYSTKISVSLMSTLKEILKKIHEKLTISINNYMFEIETHALKVINNNDYIWEMDEQIGKYNYIIECLKSNKIPEYRLVLKPVLPRIKDLSKTTKAKINRCATKDNEIFNGLGMSLNSTINSDKKLNKTILGFKKINNIPSGSGGKKDKEYLIAKPDENKKEKLGNVFKIAEYIPEDFNNSDKIRRKAIYMQRKSLKPVIINSEFYKYSSILDDLIMESIKNNLENSNPNDINIRKFSEIDKTREEEEEDEEKINTGKRSRSRGVRVSNKIGSINKYVHSLYNSNSNVESKEQRINNIIRETYSDIRIINVNRKFSIFLNTIRLNKYWNSSYHEKEDELELVIKVQLMCGMDKFSNNQAIKWKGKSSSLNININKWITFDTTYSNLPLILSILFQIKFVKYGINKGELKERKTIFWANFRIFDHLKRLQTGKSQNLDLGH